MNIPLKANDGKDRSANYILAESLEREGSISSFNYYGRQLSDYYSHVFSLIQPVDDGRQGNEDVGLV